MTINKKTAQKYFKEILQLKRTLNKEPSRHEDKLKTLAQKSRSNNFKQRLKELSEVILKEFDKHYLQFEANDDSYAVNSHFPLIKVHLENGLFDEFIITSFHNWENERLLKEMLINYEDSLTELEQNVATILNYETNFFGRIFQRAKTKKELSEAKQYVSENYTLITTIQDKWKTINERQLSLKDAKQDFVNDSTRYIDYYKSCLNYGQNETDQIIANLIKATEIDLNIILDNDIEHIEASIIDMWDKVKEEQLPEILKNIPIENLKDDAIPSSLFLNLRSANIKSVTDLLEISDEQLLNNFQLSKKNLADFKVVLSDRIENHKKILYPKLDTNSLTSLETKLLKLIYYRTTIPNDKQESINEQRNAIDSLYSCLKDIKNAPNNGYQISRQPCKEQEHFFNIYSLLVENLVPIIELINNNELARKLPISDQEVIEDFKYNSSTYFAIIDNLTGDKQQNHNSDLPDYIVEEVEETSIDTKNLNVTLRPYQKFGAKYALHYKKTLLGDEMGLGKTIQALTVINHLNNIEKNHTVVVSPLSVLENWYREIKKWTNLSTYIYRGKNRNQSLAVWQDNGGILLTNFEQTRHLLDFNHMIKIDCVIVDEAHYIKNPETKRSKNTSQLAQAAEYNLFMTGTAIENNVDEMRNLIKILNPNLAQQIDNELAVYQPELFKQTVSYVYLRRKRDDVLKELPDKQIIEKWSMFSDDEQEFYNFAVSLGINELMKMRYAGFMGSNPQKSGKISQLLDICEQAKANGDKIVIFSFFRVSLERIIPHIENDVVGYINGDIPAKDRQIMIDKLSDGPPGSILLSQIDAGGVGLNMQAASTVIICEPQWKPSTETQAISRVYRM